MDDGHDGDDARIMAVDRPVVTEDQLSVGISRIFGDQATRVRKRFQLSDAMA